MSSEDVRVFDPKNDTNTCCERCKNAAGGCAWSKDFQPVPGWKTRNTVNRDRTDGIKILYCPEFVEGDPLDDTEADTGAIFALFERLLELNTEEYKEAIKTKFNAEKEKLSSILSVVDVIRLNAELESAENDMRNCEFFLGKYAVPVKRKLLAEIFADALLKDGEKLECLQFVRK